jgi:two-component system cell cycle response regulator DivK
MKRRRPIPRAISILVVDDLPDQRELYATYFAAKGFTTSTAANGREALGQARRDLPDVIVMDLAMPHLDGWQLAEELKRDPLTRHIPIIACSAQVLGGAPERALVAGCNAYVAKPCLPQDLMSEVLRVLRKAA